jgi:hypothetical protein
MHDDGRIAIGTIERLKQAAQQRGLGVRKNHEADGNARSKVVFSRSHYPLHPSARAARLSPEQKQRRVVK